MEIKNLLEEDVKVLENKIGELREKNPDIAYRIFPMESEEVKSESKVLQAILDRLEGLERQLSLIFDGHVLMDGKFVKMFVKGGKLNVDDT